MIARADADEPIPLFAERRAPVGGERLFVHDHLLAVDDDAAFEADHFGGHGKGLLVA